MLLRRKSTLPNRFTFQRFLWGEIPVDDGVGKEIVGIAQLKGNLSPIQFAGTVREAS